MKLQEFRTKYPQYSDVNDASLTEMVNTKYPGRISEDAKPIPSIRRPRRDDVTMVERFDPRRMLPSYAYKEGLAPSDIQRYGAKKYLKSVMPESDLRDRVSLTFSPNPAVVGLRDKFPQYDDMDDVTFMEAVTEHYPEYTDILDSRKKEQENLYFEIDKIEYKQSMGMSLTPREVFINTVAVPEDRSRIAQQFALGYTNMVSFGVQNFILSKMGFEQTKPETGMEAVAAGVGSLAGFIGSPMKLATTMIKAIPGLSALYAPIKASSRMQSILKPLLRSGLQLGTAEALIAQPVGGDVEGFFQPGERMREFGGGFMFGIGLGGLGFIPSRAARMISSSLFFGLPSTLREESLEEQVFSYGFGAYAGLHSTRDLIQSEDRLRQVIEKGVTDKRDVKNLLRQTTQMMDKFDALTRLEGEPYTDILDSGRSFYTPIYKNWRPSTIKYVKQRLMQIKKEPGFKLRNDKISQLYEQLKGVSVDKVTDAQLFNLQQHITPENTPPAPTTPFTQRPPSRPEARGPNAKHLSLWHHAARLGYEQLEHMGLGEMFEKGLTGNVVRADVKATQMLKLHRQITNNWKMLVGVNKETARKLFLTEDGRLNMKQLSKNHPEYTTQYEVSNQMRRYLNTWLDIQNRHRAKYGKKPVKPLDNYITHIFDAVRKSAIEEKLPFPDYLADIMEFIPPKEANQPFLKTRRGAKGYKENIWAALDAYAFRGSDYISDDGLRQVNRTIKFLSKEIRIDHKEGKQSPIDLIGIEKSLKDWANRYAGRPGKIDEFFRRAHMRLPDVIRQNISSMDSIGGLWRTLIYTGYMGWRPKLALRNLGQHSLIIGEVGPRPLWQAITKRGDPRSQALLRDSLVLQSRELGFAPEMPYTILRGQIEGLRNSAFFLFRGADRLNVENAFMAGYFESTGGKYVTVGSEMHKTAMKRGDTVAAHTQYMYTKGNRGPISNLWGMSHGMGRFASMFTTWPINKIELDIAWSKPGHRVKLARYLGLVALGGLASVATNGKFRSTAYTGFGAETRVWEMVKSGLLSVDNLPLMPALIVGNDVKKALEDDDLWKIILYTVKKNRPFWESF